MSTIRGTRATGNINSNIIKRDVSDVISFLNQGMYPIVFLSQKPLIKGGSFGSNFNSKQINLSKRTVKNTKFEWIEDELLENKTTVSVDYVAGTAGSSMTIDVADASIFSVEDVIMNMTTKEQMLVSSVDVSANQLTVIAGWSDAGTVAAGTAGDTITRLGSAFDEGSEAGDSRSRQKELKYNYVQFFRTPFDYTVREGKISQWGENDPIYQRGIKGVEHLMEIERQFIFGKKYKAINSTTGYEVSSTGGILEFIDNDSNSVKRDLGNVAITKDLFNVFLRDAFTYTKTKEKYLLCSGTLLQAINDFYEGKIVFNDKLTSININAQYIETADGRVNLIRHPLLADTAFGASGTEGNFGLMLEMPEISYVVFDNEDTALESVSLSNNKKVVKEEYTTTAGVEVRLPKLHSYIYNFTV